VGRSLLLFLFLTTTVFLSSSPVGEVAAMRGQAVAGVPSTAVVEAATADNEWGWDPCVSL
jgi:hypothetical protein